MTQAQIQVLQKEIKLERTRDFIQFRTCFINNYDFEKVIDLARSSQIKRTGSRTTTWKLFLGLLPIESDKDKWKEKLKSERQYYSTLRQKTYLTRGENLNKANAKESIVNQSIKYLKNRILDIGSKDDKDLLFSIWKDVKRTWQFLQFFRDKSTQHEIETLLYIWAKEHPEYKYQQGMNEILATIIVTFASELYFNQCSEDSDGEEDEYLSHQARAQRIYKDIHDPQHLWADCYCAFQRIMNLGIKELYFKISNENVQDSDKEENFFSSSRRSSTSTTKQQNNKEYKRIRKQSQIKQQEEDQTRTALRLRSNKIFNSYLKVTDKALFYHLQGEEIQPELVLLKYLRCMLTRDLELATLLPTWDFILAGITENSRQVIQVGQSVDTYVEEDYFTSHSDGLIDLDYICIALLTSQRQYLLGKEQMVCLRVLLSTDTLQIEIEDLLSYAERIKKHLQDIQISGKREIIGDKGFPLMIEEEIEKYQSFSLANSENNEKLDQFQNKFFLGSPNNCFSVQEDELEYVEEKEEGQNKKTFSNLIENNDSGDYNSECFSPIGQNSDLEGENKEKQEEEKSKNIFKLKNQKGSLIYDQNTKQKRYLSPLEQFLAEQQELFKKGQNLPQCDQQSDTLTTTASTMVHQSVNNSNFTQSIFRFFSKESKAQKTRSLIEEPISSSTQENPTESKNEAGIKVQVQQLPVRWFGWF